MRSIRLNHSVVFAFIILASSSCTKGKLAKSISNPEIEAPAELPQKTETEKAAWLSLLDENIKETFKNAGLSSEAADYFRTKLNNFGNEGSLTENARALITEFTHEFGQFQGERSLQLTGGWIASPALLRELFIGLLIVTEILTDMLESEDTEETIVGFEQESVRASIAAAKKAGVASEEVVRVVLSQSRLMKSTRSLNDPEVAEIFDTNSDEEFRGIFSQIIVEKWTQGESPPAQIELLCPDITVFPSRTFLAEPCAFELEQTAGIEIPEVRIELRSHTCDGDSLSVHNDRHLFGNVASASCEVELAADFQGYEVVGIQRIKMSVVTLECSLSEKISLPGTSFSFTCEAGNMHSSAFPAFTLEECSSQQFSITHTAESLNVVTVTGKMPNSSCSLKVSVAADGQEAASLIELNAHDQFRTIPDDNPGFSQLPRKFSYNLTTDAGRIFSVGEGGLSVSSDDGNTWATFNGRKWGAADRSHCVAVVGQTWFVGLMDKGLAITRDNGTTWTRLETASGLDLSVVTGCFAKGNTVVVFAASEVRISNDLGMTWFEPEGLVSAAASVWALADQSVLYAAYGSSTEGLSISTDGGAHFSRIDSNLPGTKKIHALAVNDSSLWISTTDPKVWVTNDNGGIWTEMHSGKTFNSLAASDSTILAGTGSEGAFVSTDSGNNWNQAYGLPAGVNSGKSRISAVLISGSKALIGTGSGIALSNDSGQTWPTFLENNSIGNWVSSMSYVNGRLVVSSWGGGLAVTEDQGITWRSITAADNGILRDFIMEVQQDAAENIFLATTSGLQKSADGGLSWTTLHTRYSYSVSVKGNVLVTGGHNSGVSISQNGGVDWSHFLAGVVVYMVRQSSESDRIWASTATLGLAYTDDFGTTWNYANESTAGFWTTEGARYFVADGERVVVSVPDGLSISENSGSTWTLLSTAEGTSPANVRVLALKDRLIYGHAISGEGLAVSSDLGKTWHLMTSVQNGLTGNGATDQRVLIEDDFVVVGNSGVSISTP